MNRNNKVIQVIPNLGLAGAETMLANLTIELSNDGFDVSVVSLYNEQSSITDKLETQDIPLYYLNKKKGLDLRMIYRLYKLFIKEKPDVIHTHRYSMQYAIPASILAGVPIKIHTVHNIATKEVSNSQRKLYYLFYKYLNVIPVSISPLVKESILKEYKIPSDKVPMIYNGIDLNKCITKFGYSTNGDNITILHVGRFSEQKNHIGLIESFKLVHDKYPNTILQLIGDGDLIDQIKNKVIELKIEANVEFLGLQADVYPFLNNADIFVLPSLWEGMPITLIEAMATGLPIVATSVGGVSDMIKDEANGLLVETNNKQISEALLKLINNEVLREKIGKAARDSSKQFSAEIMAKKYEELYNKR